MDFPVGRIDDTFEFHPDISPDKGNTNSNIAVAQGNANRLPLPTLELHTFEIAQYKQDLMIEGM